MMKLPLTIKHLIWLVLAIVVAAFMLSGLVIMLFNFAKTGADWVSALISAISVVLGGIIGGIVAIIVASYQVNRAFQNEKNKLLQTSYTLLRLIHEELRDNISALDSSVPYNKDNHRVLRTQLSDDFWKSAALHLYVSDDILVRLNVCYRMICLLRNLESEDIDEQIISDTKETITKTLEGLKQEIRDIA